MKARTTIRDIDPQNDLTFLRVRSKKNEIMIAPGEESASFYSSERPWFLASQGQTSTHTYTLRRLARSHPAAPDGWSVQVQTTTSAQWSSTDQDQKVIFFFSVPADKDYFLIVIQNPGH